MEGGRPIRSYKSQLSRTGHNTLLKTFRDRTSNSSHGRETDSLQLYARPILGSFPGLVPGQSALRSNLRDATLLRGDSHFPEHALAGIHAFLRTPRHGLFNAESSSDAHVSSRWDGSSELREGLFPTAELGNVRDKADSGRLEDQSGCQSLRPRGADGEDQRWSGGDQR